MTHLRIASLSCKSGKPILQSHAFLLALISCALLWPSSLFGQQQEIAQAPLLTLEDAVSTALANNRLVKNSALEAQKFDSRVSTARSRRLPQFQFAVLGGALLHSFDFTFDKGAFGTYPNVGPIPGNDTKIRTPARQVGFIQLTYSRHYPEYVLFP